MNESATEFYDSLSSHYHLIFTFQVWDWNADGTAYTLNHFIVKQTDTTWETLYHQTHYRALQRNELTAILEEAGLTDIRWHMPDVTGFHQPIVTARNT